MQKHWLNSAGLTMSATTLVSTASVEDTEDAAADPDLETSEVKQYIILLISDDIKFDNSLRIAAMSEGHILMRVTSLTEALRTVRADCSHVVLVDLDMAADVAWEAADWLLQDSKCQRVLLATGRQEPSDIRMAVHSGAILDKNTGPSRILRAVHEILQAPYSALVERNGIQRVIVRWLRPLRWPPMSAWRHWGINE